MNLDRTKITRDGLLGFVLHRGVQTLRLSRAEVKLFLLENYSHPLIKIRKLTTKTSARFLTSVSISKPSFQVEGKYNQPKSHLIFLRKKNYGPRIFYFSFEFLNIALYKEPSGIPKYFRQ